MWPPVPAVIARLRAPTRGRPYKSPNLVNLRWAWGASLDLDA
jgi:hypothetical protein